MAQGDVSDDLKTKVAWLYYMEGLTQDKISETLGLSRYSEAQMLSLLTQNGFTAHRAENNIGHNQGRMLFLASPVASDATSV